jgi:diphosphomevalonate decarboxylase
VLARRGSGSAARSVIGGLVLLHPGSRPDGEDAFAEQLLAPGAWDLRVVVAIVTAEPKAVGSSEGMRLTATTSRLYPAFSASISKDLDEAVAAAAARDLERLGEIAERSALELHAAALAARPPLVYFRGATLAGLRAIVALRGAGVPAWFTADAGPQPKALTDAAHAPRVADALREATGAADVLVCAPGEGAEAVA